MTTFRSIYLSVNYCSCLLWSAPASLRIPTVRETTVTQACPRENWIPAFAGMTICQPASWRNLVQQGVLTLLTTSWRTFTLANLLISYPAPDLPRLHAADDISISASPLTIHLSPAQSVVPPLLHRPSNWGKTDTAPPVAAISPFDTLESRAARCNQLRRSAISLIHDIICWKVSSQLSGVRCR